MVVIHHLTGKIRIVMKYTPILGTRLHVMIPSPSWEAEDPNWKEERRPRSRVRRRPTVPRIIIRDTTAPHYEEVWEEEFYQEEAPMRHDPGRSTRPGAGYTTAFSAPERLFHETERLPSPLRDYLRPMTQDRLAMNGAARTMPRATGQFVRRLVSYSEDDDEDDVEDSECDPPSDTDEEDNGDSFASRHRSKSRNSRRARRNESVSRARSLQRDFGGPVWPPDEPIWPTGGTGGSGGGQDLVDDRYKTLVSYFNQFEIGAPTPVGSLTLKGFLGTVLRVLRPQDWAAYFRASGKREIYLPLSMAQQPPADELRELENRLLGVGQFIGSGSSMTVVTYNKKDYGTITNFDIDHVPAGGGTWVRTVRPVAALPYVPKKLLKKLIKSAPPYTGRATVQIKTRAESPGGRFTWRGRDRMPKIRFRDYIQGAVLPSKHVQALAVDGSWLPRTRGGPRNLVDATIPQMITWLHAKAAVLRNVDMVGPVLLHPDRDTSKVVVRWIEGPGTWEHMGTDPRVVALFPNDALWATKRLYWTGI
ncbi:hypothetical protein GQ53DRAFT_802556 [Thozetella sp. PMI_491]|nr:hypothetical protein GQ53DRAFT_802556 [Thozetella sp. PMI_491]